MSMVNLFVALIKDRNRSACHSPFDLQAWGLPCPESGGVSVGSNWTIFKVSVRRDFGEMPELRISPVSSWTSRVGLPVLCDPWRHGQVPLELPFAPLPPVSMRRESNSRAYEEIQASGSGRPLALSPELLLAEPTDLPVGTQARPRALLRLP